MSNSNKKYKYESSLSEIRDSGCSCPPIDACELNVIAYRWVFHPPTVESFHPQAKRNPRRLLKENDPIEKCSCWGLSMHTDLQSSISAYKAVAKHCKNMAKLFGDWVAEGGITPAHGKCTKADGFNHFDLHEYSDANVGMAFKYAKQIVA